MKTRKNTPKSKAKAAKENAFNKALYSATYGKSGDPTLKSVGETEGTYIVRYSGGTSAIVSAAFLLAAKGRKIVPANEVAERLSAFSEKKASDLVTKVRGGEYNNFKGVKRILRRVSGGSILSFVLSRDVKDVLPDTPKAKSIDYEKAGTFAAKVKANLSIVS